MEELRDLAYPKTHVILLGYNTSHPESLENAQTTWQEELKEKAAACEITKDAPCILVGTMVITPQPPAPSLSQLSTAAGAALQSDKRDDEAAAGNLADTYVTAAQGWAVRPTFTNLAAH